MDLRVTDADDSAGQIPTRKHAAALPSEQAGPAGAAVAAPEGGHQGEGGGPAPAAQRPRTRPRTGGLLVTNECDTHLIPRDFQQGILFHNSNWSRYNFEQLNGVIDD